MMASKTGKVTPIDEKFGKKPDNNITTFEGSTLWAGNYTWPRYNPDTLVGKQGLGIYSKMLIDEQVKAVVEFKGSAVLARGWEFYFADSQLDAEEKKFRIGLMNTIVKRMRGSFRDALEGIASGREYGYSVTEKVYGQVTYQGQAYKAINQLLTRDPSSFEFHTDDFGVLDSVLQKVTGKPSVDLDRDRLIHYVHAPKWDRIFGRSDLRSAYRSWYAKDQLVKMELMYLEKFAGGIVIARRTGDEAPSYGSPEYNSLQEGLANISSFRSITLPRGIEATMEFPASTDQFREAITYHDLAMAKALLVPNLLGLSHTGQTGAYAQSQTQLEAFFWTLGSDAMRLEECLNEQLFRDLCDQNFGDDDYPLFRFKPASMEHVKWVIGTWKDLLGAEAVIQTEEDEAHLRSLLEMPDRTDESIALVNPVDELHRQQDAQAKADALQTAVDAQQGAKQAAVDNNIAALSARIEQLSQPQVNVAVTNTAPPATPAHDQVSTLSPDVAPAGGAVPHGELRGVTLSQFQRSTQRVAFSVIEQRTDAYAKSAVQQLAAIVAKATKRALGDDANLAGLTDTDPSDVAAMQLAQADVGKLKAQYRALLDQSWKLGQDLARNEVARASASAKQTFSKRVTLASLLDNAAAYFDTSAFRMAGDTSDQTKKVIQQELQNGIKTGRPLTDVRTAIWDRLVSKGLTSEDAVRGVETDEAVSNALDLLWQDTPESATAYLNTLVRTNTFEALNEARFAEFTDPALADFVLGFAYAAVMDSSTTEICSYLDGRQYAADSPVWDEYRPPNHFNCRSVLVPITAIDGWDGQESDPPSIQPQEGFK